MNARCLAVAVMGALASAPALAAQDRGEGSSGLSFMVGCWAEDPAGNGLREIYAAPAANLMTGLSQFWRSGRIVDFEFHRIEMSTEGPILTPHPRGVASVPFLPVETGPDRIVWENAEHDFPQRIVYERVAADSLVARIEGGEGDERRSLEWRMARSSCPGEASR